MAAEILESVPEHGGGQAAVTTLRRSTESAVLAALQLLSSDAPPPIPRLTDETREGCLEFARRGIPLDQVLRGVRLGHARLAHDLAAAIEEHVPAEDRLTELRQITDLLFGYADIHASLMAEEYIAERDRWRGSGQAARRAIVDELIAGRPIDSQSATRRLGYDISLTHIAAVMWVDDSQITTPSAELLHHTAGAMARTLHAAGMMLIPANETGTWVWFALPGEKATDPAEQLRSGLARPEGVHAALGPPARGPHGMRRSHLCALQAQRIAFLMDGDWLCNYLEHRLVALATKEPEHARWFVQDTLGPLASEGDRMWELRETLRVYLDEERSLRAAGERLHVARNTVTYRVKRAEELLPRSAPTAKALELRLALEIAQTLGVRDWGMEAKRPR
ncbi:PucR family transcriptional regulator [Streptomyces sp. NPDC008343]|uniref:PucR family transcriptional regulator n=1 Tax=Streptomyces sp. NPDC008343 TaxID=3364828 RepID=UPI0036EE90E8